MRSWLCELPTDRYSVMLSLHFPSNSMLRSVHYYLIVWHFLVTWLCLHKRLPQFLCRFFLLTSFFFPPSLSPFFFLNLSELSLDVLCTRGLQRAQDMFVAGEIFCPGSHSNRQHQLPEAHCLHTLLLHSFSLFLFSEELLLMSTHQQTKQMGWWKMNN